MAAAIGIDLGTSGVRACLRGSDGTMLGFAAVRGVAAEVRAPLAWQRLVIAALQQLGRRADLGQAEAIAVAGTSGTILAIGKDGAPRGQASLYSDPADPAAVARVAAIAPLASAARGAVSPLAKALAWPAGYARLLHQADWIAGMLCGRFDVSDENNALKTGYDPVARRWPDWVTAFGLKLPDVVPSGTLIGHTAAGIAGLPAGIAVKAGTTDGCAAFLATGAGVPGEAVTSLGSTLTLKLLSDTAIFAPRYGIYSHRLGDRWLAGGASNSGGAVLARYFDAVQLAELPAAIDPARESGFDYYPLLAAGERFPVSDPDYPPRLSPRPADDAAFLHGMLEGIARIEAHGYALLASLGAPPLQNVRTAGGGARNAVWTAMRGRMLGVPMLKAAQTEAAAGAARLALEGW